MYLWGRDYYSIMLVIIVFDADADVVATAVARKKPLQQCLTFSRAFPVYFL